jgi:hypothetical protein
MVAHKFYVNFMVFAIYPENPEMYSARAQREWPRWGLCHAPVRSLPPAFRERRLLALSQAFDVKFFLRHFSIS